MAASAFERAIAKLTPSLPANCGHVAASKVGGAGGGSQRRSAGMGAGRVAGSLGERSGLTPSLREVGKQNTV